MEQLIVPLIYPLIIMFVVLWAFSHALEAFEAVLYFIWSAVNG